MSSRCSEQTEGTCWDVFSVTVISSSKDFNKKLLLSTGSYSIFSYLYEKLDTPEKK
jgi:hypothetical protein